MAANGYKLGELGTLLSRLDVSLNGLIGVLHNNDFALNDIDFNLATVCQGIIISVWDLFDFDQPSDAFSAAKIPRVDAIIEEHMVSLMGIESYHQLFDNVTDAFRRLPRDRINRTTPAFKFLLSMLVRTRICVKLSQHGKAYDHPDLGVLRLYDNSSIFRNLSMFVNSKTMPPDGRHWNAAEKDQVLTGYLSFIKSELDYTEMNREIKMMGHEDYEMFRNALISNSYTEGVCMRDSLDMVYEVFHMIDFPFRVHLPFNERCREEIEKRMAEYFSTFNHFSDSDVQSGIHHALSSFGGVDRTERILMTAIISFCTGKLFIVGKTQVRILTGGTEGVTRALNALDRYITNFFKFSDEEKIAVCSGFISFMEPVISPADMHVILSPVPDLLKRPYFESALRASVYAEVFEELTGAGRGVKRKADEVK